jgi:magnesium chelatase family protein
VAAARERQHRRLAGSSARCNGEMDTALVDRLVRLDGSAARLLARAYSSGALSARGRQRVIRVARTLADLEDSEPVRGDDVLTALSLRQRSPGEEALAA